MKALCDTVMFAVGDSFRSFSELGERISEFENKSFVQLYVRRSRSIEATAKRAPKKQFKQDLKYAEIDYVCIHGGRRDFKSTSTGKGPNQW